MLANIEPVMEKAIRERFGVEAEQVRRDEFYLEDRFNIPKKEMEAFIRGELFIDPEFWLAATPFESHVQKLKQWYDGYKTDRIYIVTGRHNDMRPATEQWLQAMNIPFDCLFMDTLHDKANVMKYVNADFIIEDRFEEVWLVAKAKRRAYIIEKEYNVKNRDKRLQGRYKDNIIWVTSFTGIEDNEGMK